MAPYEISATGSGIEQAEVSVVGANDATLRTTSGDSGHCRLSGLRPGVVLLAVRRVGYYPDTARVRVLDSGVTRVDFKLQSSTVLEAQLYVDGHPYSNGNVDDFSPIVVEGIEVFAARPKSRPTFERAMPSAG